MRTRIVVVFALVVLAPIFVTSQNQPSSAQKRQDAQQTNPAVPVTVNCNCESKTDDGKDKPQGWHKLITWPEGIATWALILTFGAIFWQAIASSRAAEAALLNSIAAKQGVEIIISKERIRIEVEPHRFHMHFGSDPVSHKPIFEPNLAQQTGFTIHFYGLTEGYIQEARAGACISTSEDAPNAPFTEEPPLPPRIIPNGDKSDWPQSLQLFPRMENLDAMFDVVEGRKFVHLWGFIRYRDAFYDVFREERVTAFRYVWNYTMQPTVSRDSPLSTPLGGRFGKWRKCGPPEDNRET